MKRNKKLIPLIVILGPTASGKSTLAVRLAQTCNGEIVSADSRQIYKGMEIGAGTVTKTETKGIPHHLLSFQNPKRPYNAHEYQRAAIAAIRKIARAGKIPLLVGGAGFWIDAVCQNLRFPNAKPDRALRKKLKIKTAQQLFSMLEKLDPEKAKTIDQRNPHRLMRAIEIAKMLGKHETLQTGPQLFSCLYLGIARDNANLKSKITKRFNRWLKAGFLNEVQALMKKKLSEERFRELGLHYWYAYTYLSNRISRDEFVTQSIVSIWHYAKRQMTWFRRNKNIHWVTTFREAKKLASQFVKNGELGNKLQ